MRPNINIVLWLVFAVLLTMSSPAAWAADARFSMYAYALMGQDRKPAVKVSIHVPHASLVFLKSGDLYQARYKVYVRIVDPKDEQLFETSVLSQDVVETTYKETRSQKKSSSLSQEFPLKPGNYLVKCRLEVENTSLVFTREEPVTVPDFFEKGVGVNKPRLFSTETDTTRFGNRVVRMEPGAAIEAVEKEATVFAEFDKQPAFEFEVYLETPIEDSVDCQLYYEVVDQKKEQVVYGRKRFRLSGSEGRFMATFNIDDWEPGWYTFTAKAALEDPPRAAANSLRFSIEFSRAMLFRHFDETLETLSLIADAGDIAPLKAAAPADRARLWAEFWERRDPTPGTGQNEALEEYLRRVRYVAENFSSVESGWRTDRGKVYIRYGEPDETETRSDPYFQGSYLIWRYYQKNLTFVFYDRFGLGDYRLTNTSEF
jgi:GWxTD domain-containing protein